MVQNEIDELLAACI